MIKVNKMDRITLNLSQEYDNKANVVEFDISEWVEKYGNGSVTLLHKRNGDSEAYPISLTVTNGIAKWNISNTDTAKVGSGTAQLKYVPSGDNTVKVHSALARTIVLKSNYDVGDVPSGYDDWLDNLTDLANTTTTNASTASTKATEASTSASNASASASSASTSATTATNAKNDAVSAKNSAVSAKDDAVTAKNQAQAIKDSMVVPTKTSELTNDSGFVTDAYHDSTKVDDVQINGTSIKADGIANIPLAKNGVGAVRLSGYGFAQNGSNGVIYVMPQNYATYQIVANEYAIAKGTLENVLANRLAEPQYELIEEITLTEVVTSIERNAFPNGNAYNLKQLAIQVEIPPENPSVARTILIGVNGNSAFGRWESMSNASYKVFGGSNIYIDGGRMFCPLSSRALNFADNVSAIHSTPIGVFGVSANSINTIKLTINQTTSGFPSGTKITLYGVRG